VSDPGDVVNSVFREEWPRVVASLARRFGDLDIAEEAAGEAFVAAVEHWRGGIPPNPGGWLMTTASRKAIDRLRRESRRDQKHEEAAMLASPPAPTGVVEDDQLRLMFVCCHPALAPEARVALTLRMVGGLTVAEIARAFLVPETTIAQRITRAKRKVREARVAFRLPDRDDLVERVGGVLSVLYLVFNEGYLAGAGDEPIRVELTDEAIRLTRLLHDLLPADGEVVGLLALMLLIESRRLARTDDEGELLTLDEQDRSLWNTRLVAEGQSLVLARIATGEPPGPYQLQAAINAVHTAAATFADTDWAQLSRLYDDLYALMPTPVVALNRAIVRAELAGAEPALAEIDALGLDGYHAWHASRADLLRRLGRHDEARAAYARAIETTGNAAEARLLSRRMAGLPA